MSVFSNPQGRPPGVRALLGLLAAFPEGLTLKEIQAWMSPASDRANADDETGEGTSKTRLSNTMGVARSLKLIEGVGDRHRVAADVAAATDLATLVHERFVATQDDSDRLLVALYAFIVCRSQQEGGVSWLAQVTNKELADAAEAAFKATGDEHARITVNTTRFASWKEWTGFVGLGFDGIPRAPVFFLPEATVRIGKELELLGTELGFDQAHAAAKVIGALSERCPYLDGGSAHRALATALGLQEQMQLSPILSRALRGLNTAQRITLEGGGDTSGSLTLVSDGVNRAQPFSRIRIRAPQRAS